ncbi:MAG: PhoH family protein [Candidatus Omnitrophica bacterium]|nr:PhoH family protein [Candidatus Omnitrophota bacterium]
MERKIKLKSLAEAQSLLGPFDRNLKAVEKEFRVKLALRGEYLKLSGSLNDVKRAADRIQTLIAGFEAQRPSQSLTDVRRKVPIMKKQKQEPADREPRAAIGRGMLTKPIGPKTKGQREYFEAMKKYDIVFGIGPAGTGKTYLAMASAVEALKGGLVRRIILTRPAIEAGESLGYLPGDMYEKISPYLRPLYDALYDMMEAERIEKYLETGIIEVAPLAYMRGRTLNDAFIILDEAQNATHEQMKMFLTRLGYDSKAVITGDITQSDLPGGKPLGLLQAMEVLKEIEGIKFIYFSGADVVRHELVQKIIEAYEKTLAGR